MPNARLDMDTESSKKQMTEEEIKLQNVSLAVENFSRGRVLRNRSSRGTQKYESRMLHL